MLSHAVGLNSLIASIGRAAESADVRPTQGAADAFAELSGRLQEQLAEADALLEDALPGFDAQLREAGVPRVSGPGT